MKFEDVKDTGILCDEYNEYDKETGAVELKDYINMKRRYNSWRIQ